MAGNGRHQDITSTLVADVTFVVLDVETTGASPAAAALTEVAALLVRDQEHLASFQSLVDARVPVPAYITDITGISEEMVRGAPGPAEVAQELVRFSQGAVIVGHNVGFDLSFLNAALAAGGFPPMDGPVLDTLRLARRLVRKEVPDCKLATLASTLGLRHQPSHRSLDDVLATVDLLYLLIERAGGSDSVSLRDLL